MRMPIWRYGLAVLLSGLPTVALAQDPATPPQPASLAYAEGAVDLDHEGVAEAAVAPAVLLEGDRVRVRDGRAEVVFADGSLLHADRNTVIEWLGAGHLRLLEGRIAVRLSASAASYVVDTPPGAVRLEPRGEYNLGVRPGADLQLAIVRGVAELDGPGERLVARGGETLVIDGAGRAETRRFNSARFDDFTRWAYDRANGGAYGASAQYLPPELRAYGSSLDPYGRWDYMASYGGYVWYPSVAVGWRPYSHGGWRHTRYGWTWYGIDRWSYPTHHFGRWGYSGSSWFWMPNKVWGPAWVSWAFAPGFVSWCPLGWDGRPVLGFWNRPGRVVHDPWRAWTAVPRNRFGQRGPVQSWIVDAHRLPESSRRAFVLQSAAPPAPARSAARDYAVPRGNIAGPPPAAAADRRPGAVPRQNAPAPSGAVTSAPQSWSRPAPASGAVRRPPPASSPSPSSTTPVMENTTPSQRNTTPTAGDTAPSAIPRTDPRTGTQYAIPRRPADGSYSREDADAFRSRGRSRAPEAARPAGGQTPGQSWTPRERGGGTPQNQGAARGQGAVERARPTGEGGAASPPPQPKSSGDQGSKGNNGSSGGSRGASRRPPK